MMITLDRSQINKISLIIFLIAICVPLIIYNGTIDDFVPKHIAAIQATSDSGNLIKSDIAIIQQVPGFDVLGAIISLILGLAAEKLIFSPIQLIPYAVLFFTILYKISDNPILSIIITFVEIISGSSGTSTVYFWPHGIGFILVLTIFLIVLNLLKQDICSKPLALLGIITCISLVYISYDYNAMILIFLSIIVGLLGLIYVLFQKRGMNIFINHSLPKKIIPILIILIVCTFGLSQFFYKSFIPSVQVTQKLEMSSLDKFMITYSDPTFSNVSISPIMINYPVSVSIVSAIKYGVLSLTLLIFIYVITKKIINKKLLNQVDIFVFSIFLMYILYMVPRVTVGAFSLGFIYLPGIYCIAYCSQLSKNYKLWAYFALSILLICTVSHYFIMLDNKLINSDEYQFISYKTPAEWIFEVSDGRLAVSDEYTKNFFILNLFNKNREENPNLKFVNIYNNNRIITPDDTLSLIQLSEKSLGNKYFILNNRLTTMSLQNWIIIRSWNYYMIKIDNNEKINKLYNTPLISIYSSH